MRLSDPTTGPRFPRLLAPAAGLPLAGCTPKKPPTGCGTLGTRRPGAPAPPLAPDTDTREACVASACFPGQGIACGSLAEA